jgi:predicted esterase
MKRTITSLALFLFLVGAAFAQQTGLWSESVAFSTASYPGQTRTFVYRVPASYSAANKYKVVIALHGQGDNSTSFLTTMWQVFGQTAVFGNVILMAPSEGTNLSGFTEPVGEDTGILEALVARAKTMYNLDTTKIYISGFSRGARSGLKLGLDKPLKYRGMMLYTPALLSLNEAKNLTSYQLNYANGAFIPVCMTVGANDPNGYPAIDAEVQNQLAAISNKSMLKSLPGVGHNVPQTMQDYIDCYNFVETHLYTSTTGVDGLPSVSSGIELFPNPSSGLFYIGLYNEISLGDNVLTTVYNVAGQKVYEQENQFVNQVHAVDITGQPAGLYMVVVKTSEGAFTKKLLVQ